MYSLMVFDDEPIAIESVKHIVKNEFKNIQVTQTAKSGKEAIEKARIQRPDIILTDIKMPGINGLEAVKEIKKIHNNIKFIIVSVYEYFDYAKQAVELGVIDYLTKPVNKTRLVETLQRIINQLDEEKYKFGQELEAREKLEKMISISERSFIYSLLLSQPINYSEYKTLFNFEGNMGYICVLTFQGNKNRRGQEQFCDNICNQKFYSFFKDNLKYKYQCIVGPIMLDRVVIYIAQSEKDQYQQRVQTIAYLEDIVNRMENTFDVSFKIGIGKAHDDSNIIVSYHEALRALNYAEEGKIMHIDDIAPFIDEAAYEFFTEESKLIAAVEKGDVQLCINTLSDIFNKYTNYFEKQSLRSRLIEIMIVARRIGLENGINYDKYIENTDFFNRMFCCGTKQEFEQMCMEWIRYIASKIRKSKGKTIGIIVDKANKIIDERFNQELTLDDISKELFVSPQYFSRLYKQEMGTNFIEQLTLVRMQNAKKLIEHGEYSIKEVCYMSGYSDPNYFSRLFKKYEGVSPTTYQKQI